ncbi:exonuclease domain-containing protein [Actinomadura hibisca]|uniref:exonuclease domain-containing protein n=1 Tax=Actinomadura hibisca TaxID=68565 RepID=UPI00082958B0|nr:exonuclease domain-containing protein [Actinomadura hibisca]
MTPWHTGPLCALDFETTGVDVEESRIVTACIARIDGTGQAPTVGRTWLVNPGVEIPASAAGIHGVTTARARAEGVEPVGALAEIVDMLARALETGAPIVGFNIRRYDLPLLMWECRRHGLPTLEQALGRPIGPVIDARVLDKQVSRRSGKRKLVNCCEFWNVGLDAASAHDASADAWGAAGVAVRIAQKNAAIGRMSADELHDAQAGWARAQDADFARWLRGKAMRARTSDEQLDSIRDAEHLEATAGEWPLIVSPRQESLS